MENRITFNYDEEDDNTLHAIKDTHEILTDMYEKGIIDDKAYMELLEETCDDALYAEKEEDFDEEYEYIYKVEFLGMGRPEKLFYKHAEDTHWIFNMSYNIGFTEVKYIRVAKSSPEYQSAFYNSKCKNIIKLPKNRKTDDNIFLKVSSMDV